MVDVFHIFNVLCSLCPNSHPGWQDGTICVVLALLLDSVKTGCILSMLANSNLRHRSGVSSSVRTLLHLHATLLLLLLPDGCGDDGVDLDDDYDRMIILHAALLLFLLPGGGGYLDDD